MALYTTFLLAVSLLEGMFLYPNSFISREVCCCGGVQFLLWPFMILDILVRLQLTFIFFLLKILAGDYE